MADATATSRAPAGFDSRTMAQMVRRLPDDALRAGLEVNREAILSEVFERFPERLTSRGRGTEAVIKWKVGGAPGGGHDRFSLVLGGGSCAVVRGDTPERARTTITIDRPLDLLKLVTGNANPVALFMRRRIKVHGDLMLAASLTTLFEIPR